MEGACSGGAQQLDFSRLNVSQEEGELSREELAVLLGFLGAGEGGASPREDADDAAADASQPTSSAQQAPGPPAGPSSIGSSSAAQAQQQAGGGQGEAGGGGAGGGRASAGDLGAQEELPLPALDDLLLAEQAGGDATSDDLALALQRGWLSSEQAEMLLSLLEQGMSSASSARVAPGQPGCLARARPPGSRHRRSGARPPPGPVVEPFWDWEAAGATDSLPLLPSPGGGDPSGGPFGPPRRKVHVHRSGKSATSAAAQAWLAPPAEAAGEGGQGEGGEPAAAGAAPAAPTNVHAAAAAPDSQQPASAPASARPDQGGGSSAKGPVGAPSRGITKGQLAAFLAGEGRWRGGRSSSQPARHGSLGAWARQGLTSAPAPGRHTRQGAAGHRR